MKRETVNAFDVTDDHNQEEQLLLNLHGRMLQGKLSLVHYFCQATGTGAWAWDWGLGLGTREWGMGNDLSPLYPK